MPRSFENSPRRARGSMLLEALIGVVITGIIGAGTAHIAARIAVGQHELRVEGVAVSQLRQLLNARGESLCGSSGNVMLMPGGATTALAIQCDAAAPSLTVLPGVVSTDPAIPASVTVDGLRTVAARVELDDMGIKADASQFIVVGTRQ